MHTLQPQFVLGVLTLFSLIVFPACWSVSSISVTGITLLGHITWNCFRDDLIFVQCFEFVSNIIAMIPRSLLEDSPATANFHGITARIAWQTGFSHLFFQASQSGEQQCALSGITSQSKHLHKGL